VPRAPVEVDIHAGWPAALNVASFEARRVLREFEAELGPDGVAELITGGSGFPASALVGSTSDRAAVDQAVRHGQRVFQEAQAARTPAPGVPGRAHARSATVSFGAWRRGRERDGGSDDDSGPGRGSPAGSSAQGRYECGGAPGGVMTPRVGRRGFSAEFPPAWPRRSGTKAGDRGHRTAAVFDD
jgi:hypothetical protein